MTASHDSYEDLVRARRCSDEYRQGYAEAQRAFQIGRAVRERPPAGFQNSATGSDLGFYAERSFSLTRPPTMGRRLIRS